ncbi:MAG: hypothetical protein V4574_04500 [Pseudomonadota bacterium]
MTAGRTAIANQQFAQLVKEHGNGPFQPVVVLNTVDLSDFAFERTLIFRDVVFRGGIDASGSTFASLKFMNCTFEEPLKANNCVFNGDLVLENCRFLCALDDREPATAVQLDRSQVSGKVTLATDGSLSMRSAEVRGDVAVHLIASLPDKPAQDAAFVRIEHCEIGGSIEIVPKPPGTFQERSRPGARQSRARIAGLVSLQGSGCASVKIERIDALAIKLDDAIIRGRCDILTTHLAAPVNPMLKLGAEPLAAPEPADGWLSAKSLQTKRLDIEDLTAAGLDLTFAHTLFTTILKATIKGNILAYGATFDYILRFTELDCGGNLDLPRAQISGQLALLSGRVAGRVWMSGTTIGSTVMGGDAALEIGSLSAVDSSFNSYFSLSHLTVGGADAARFKTGALEHGMVEFRHCHFGSYLSFWRASSPVKWRGGDDFGWLPRNNVRIWRNLEITHCEIDSSVTFTRVQLGLNGEVDDGALMLDRSRIGGPLQIASPVSVAEREDLPAGRRAAARKAAARSGELAATMRRLSLRDVKAIDVDLTGLALADPGATTAGEANCGDVRAERIEVTGSFSTYVCADSREACWAVIPGTLRLDEAEIGELRLSENSFGEADQAGRERGPAAKVGIVLERAIIGRLHVPRAEASARGTRNGFPVPLDLSGVQVRHWSFDNTLNGEPSSDSNEFLDFLDNDEGMHRDVYRSVADALRGAGHDAAAERVLFAEEYRARTPASRWRPGDGRPWRRIWFIDLGLLSRPIGRMQLTWPRPIRILDRVLTSYRRAPTGLWLPIIGLFALSWVLVSHDPRNFELAESAKVSEMLRCRTPVVASGTDYRVIDGAAIPDPASWSWLQQAWMTARYHIPIINLAVREDIKPSGDRLRLSAGPAAFSGEQLKAAPTDLCATPNATARASEAHDNRFSAEDWFGIMSILNWIMWPILLTFLLRRALRGD